MCLLALNHLKNNYTYVSIKWKVKVYDPRAILKTLKIQVNT